MASVTVIISVSASLAGIVGDRFTLALAPASSRCLRRRPDTSEPILLYQLEEVPPYILVIYHVIVIPGDGLFPLLGKKPVIDAVVIWRILLHQRVLSGRQLKVVGSMAGVRNQSERVQDSVPQLVDDFRVTGVIEIEIPWR